MITIYNAYKNNISVNRTRYDRDVILYCVYDTTCVYGDFFFFVCLFGTATLMNLPSPERRSLTRTRKKGSCEGPVSSIESEFVRSQCPGSCTMDKRLRLSMVVAVWWWCIATRYDYIYIQYNDKNKHYAYAYMSPFIYIYKYIYLYYNVF